MDAVDDIALDVDADGVYDYLAVRYSLEVLGGGPGPGQVHLSALLVDEGQNVVAWGDEDIPDQTQSPNASGEDYLVLYFPAGAIRAHGVDGPYYVEETTLANVDGSVLDYHINAYETNTYAAGSFAPPLVRTTGYYDDRGVDINGDTLYEYLDIDIELEVGKAGDLVVRGRLVDDLGSTIAWAEVEATVATIDDLVEPVVVTLPFPGSAIAANQQDGPFELRSLRVYHRADPDQHVFIDVAHTTAAYSWTQFNAEP